MGYDYSNFFKPVQTEQIFEQEFVKDEDIDGEKYVEGSQGEIKKLKMVSDSDTNKIGSQIEFQQKVFTFLYEEPEFPNKPTSIERKSIKKEVDI